MNLISCDLDDLHAYSVCQMKIEDLASTLKRSVVETYAAHYEKIFFH